MEAYRTEATLTKERTLQITDLPLEPGAEVDVIIYTRNRADDPPQSDTAYSKEWVAASQPALREIWDNDEDAAYDRI